jgi:RimJ/RimL family protein N-acetyltransferase
MQISTIETERLTMRPFVPGDLDRLADILSSPDVMRYMPGGKPLPREKAEAHITGIQKHWEQHGYGWWAVICNADSQLTGWCGLTYLPELEEVEVAYLFDKPYWGQGVGTEAAHASLRYAFEELQMERIIALAHIENIASQRVMEKNGMTREKELHLWGLDLVQYGISRDAFRPSQKKHALRKSSALA